MSVAFFLEGYSKISFLSRLLIERTRTALQFSGLQNTGVYFMLLRSCFIDSI